LLIWAAPLIDDDLSLHIGLGRAYIAAGSIPNHDIFSFTAQGVPWHPHNWLYSQILALAFSVGSGPALLLLRGVIWLVLILLLVALSPAKRRGWPYYAVLLIGILAAPPLWRLRSHLFFTIGIILSWWVAHPARPTRGGVTTLLLYFLFWAQVHASFPIGVALWFWWRVGYLRTGLVREITLTLLLITITFINPQGPGLWLWPLGLLEGGKNILVAEWGNLLKVPVSLPLLFLLAFIILVIVAIWRAYRAGFLPWRETVVWLGFILWTLLSRRMVAPLVVCGIITVAACARHDILWRRREISGIIMVVLLLGIAYSFGAPAMVQGGRDFFAAEPRHSLTRIAEIAPPDFRLFHPYEWGGPLILWNYPRLRTFLDSRTEVFSPELLEDYGRLYNGEADWEGIMERYQLDGALLPGSAPLAAKLVASPDWRLQHQRPGTLFFVREIN